MPLEDLYPLSAIQQGLLFETLADPEGARYVQQLRWRAEGPLDPGRYRAAWQRITDRHAVLRTLIAGDDGGNPLQAVLTTAELPVIEEDWRGTPESTREARLDAFCRADRLRGFSTEHAPLSRLALVRLGKTTWESVWTFHHLLLDGWSIGRLIHELGPLYTDPTTTLARPPRYREYIGWLTDRDHRAAHTYWGAYLAGFTTPTTLDLAAGSPGDEPTAERTHVLDQGTEERLGQTARRIRATPGVVAQAAWAVVLGRYTDRDDIVFGTTVSGRPPDLPRVEEMIGLFINTLPVRARLDPQHTAAELIRTLHTAQLDREPHEHTPLHEIQGQTALAPGTPLFDTLCVYENYPISAPLPDQRILPGIDLVQGRNTEITHYGLTLSLVPQERLRVFASFDPRTHDPRAVERLLRQYARVLDQIAADPEQPLHRLTLADDDEKALLRRWTRGCELAIPASSVQALIEERAAADPERLAVVADATGEGLTYGQLVDRSTTLARVLIAQGVRPGDLVGVCLERSPELIVALLAVLTAGAAYVPLEPELPPERLAFLVDDARPAAIIGRTTGPLGTPGRLPAVRPSADHHGGRHQLGPIIDIEAALEHPGPAAAQATLPTTTPDSLAYCLYTSGSTGRPKGVLIEHRGLVNRLLGMQDSYRLRPTDRVLHKTALGFDVSGWEVFWPLITGARLVLAAPGGQRDPEYLARVVRQRRITVTHFVPSMLAEFVRATHPGQLSSLRLVICSGEALPPSVARRLIELCPTAELHNLYGPTEASIDVCAQPIHPPVVGGALPIGRPVQNTELQILDRHLRPLPIGAVGELCIGGPQLARGYHRRPALTEERFPPHPQHPGQRLYRSGDLVRWRSDGSLDFLGRADQQFKLNGMRMEPGEIEHALTALVGIDHAVVSLREGRLHAHLMAGGKRWGTSELRNALARTLPDQMIPSHWHWLDTLPTLPNGKIDRARILAMAGTVAERSTPYTPPSGPVAELVTRVWGEVLAVEHIGVDDDFRELGGGSLDLVRVAFRLREELDRPVELRELIRHSTIRALAAALEGAGETAPTWGEADERLDLPAVLPPRTTTRGASVLLTGATGYLGAFLLTELLQRTTGTVRCLIRASTEPEARQRLDETLHRYGTTAPPGRVHALPGDLGRPRLGLSAAEFDRLGDELDLIIHAGASVDMLASFDQLAPVNIGGTRELIQLAATGRLKPLHYISTGDPKDDLVRSQVGYALTKWRAERLVAGAREAGVPATVLRLPRLTGDRAAGRWNERDMALRLLRLVVESGAAPPLGTEDWVPVDEAAALAVAEALDDGDGGLYTVTTERSVSLDALIDLVRQEGHPIERVSGTAWDALLADRFPLEHELLRTLAEERPTEDSPRSIDDWGVLPSHAFTALTLPGVDQPLLRRYAQRLSSTTTHQGESIWPSDHSE
ncbi:amino acid adenylation domain-containing protein [Streptomyces albipurpureus]|uniref:Amino acid adenylation domain-containing protein n=1 Tax=Streptomyces albipurpureus TaxID=2897419 RepID=A0ABT0UL21_9ACTN|nr:amino acid adenylation domain-containing protein [Streptomyces sp. CWNU-1]MCM2387971.1 amino acid adenylation domain-containing protein [Streptomyces sp. CWNU-1]